MNFEEDCDDCAIYIEELKSDDANLKINAVSKITSIAEIIGARRVREELIPYLTQVISDLDNEDEFLIKLAGQILLLNESIGGSEHSHLLLTPLELISSMEEPFVREKAVEGLIRIAAGQSSKFFTSHFLPMIRQLSQWDNYSSRISSCSLLGACYTQLSPPERKDIFLTTYDELTKDDTPSVRRTAASILPAIAESNTPEFIITTLLPIWHAFLKDQSDSVRVKAVEVTEKLLKPLTKAQITSHIIPPLRELLALKNKSWRIRYAIAEILEILASNVDRESSKKEIVTTLETLLKDSEHEVRAVALSKLLAIPLTETVLSTSILPILHALAQDASQQVRTSLGEVICVISLQFDAKNVITSLLLPTLETLLKDEILDVRLSVITAIHHLNKHLGCELVKRSVLPLFAAVPLDKQWRYRLAFVELLLPQLVAQLTFVEMKDAFAAHFNALIFDHYSAVRQQNFLNIRTLIADAYTHVNPIFHAAIFTLADSSNYIFRVSALQGVLIVAPALLDEDLQAIFQELTEKLLVDNVLNVKISILQLYLAMQHRFQPSTRQAFTGQVKLRYAHEKDADIVHYMTQI